MADGGDGTGVVLNFPILQGSDSVEYDRAGYIDKPIGHPHGDRPGDPYPPAAQEVNPNSPPAKMSPEDELFAILSNLAHIGIAIARNKNADYAGNGDPFANFKLCEQIGVSTLRGMLVRKLDKLARVSNLITRPPAVADEPLIATLVDDAMYSLLMAAYVKMHPESVDGNAGR
jgi:hypothetical protein